MGSAVTPATTKLTAAGNIKASAGKLLWYIISNTTGAGKKVVFNDATSGTGSEKFQVAVPGDDSKAFAFPKAFNFATGIHCGTLETGLIVVCGYE